MKVTGVEVPPPGAGFTTTTWTVPADARSAVVAENCSSVLLMKLVVRLDWLHCTAELERNPVPLIVTVVVGSPAVALAGETEVTEGLGVVVDVVVPPPPLELLPLLPPPPHADKNTKEPITIRTNKRTKRTGTRINGAPKLLKETMQTV